MICVLNVQCLQRCPNESGGYQKPVLPQGAGAGAARRFAKEGYKIALVSRKKESTDPIEKELKAAGGDAISVLADTGLVHILTLPNYSASIV